MTIVSSISTALESVHIPTALKSFQLGHIQPMLDTKNIPASTVATIAAILGASYFIYKLLRSNQPKAYLDIPRMSTYKSILQILKKQNFVSRYNANMRTVLEKHGIARLDLFGRRIVHLASPEYARQLLLNTDDFPKVIPTIQRPNALVSKFFGVNLVFSNGEIWKRHRKISNPAFHKSWSTEVFGERVEAMVKSILAEPSNAVKIHDYSQRLTLDVLGKAAFGYDFNSIEDPNGEFVTKYNSIIRTSFQPLYFLFPWLESVPFFRRTKLLKSVGEFDNLMFRIIDAKKEKLKEAKLRGDVADESDLLSLMINANEEEGGLSTEELRANMVIFFVAGHDTTANALACSLYYIAKYPDVQEKLHAEITGILGPPNDSNPPIPTVEEGKRMEYLNAIMKETLRLHPSVSMLPQRYVEHNVQVGPYVIPSGSEVSLNIYSIHHNPKYWDEPEVFRPDRFKDANADIDDQGGIVGGKRDPLAWVPFSYGTRSCIGMNFSLIEQRVALSMLIHKFKFSLPADSKHANGIQFRGSGGLTQPDGLDLIVEPRY